MIAHRGLAVEAPENTLLAFAAAIGIGVTHVETDVRATRDGIAVICHDEDIARLAGRPGAVSEFTLAELQRTGLGGGQGFCSLTQALDAFPDTCFNIDIKSHDAIAPTVTAILRARATHRVLVTSFSERRRASAVAALPGVATSASAVPFAIALVAGTLGITPLLRFVLRSVDAVQVPERAIGLAVTTKRMIRRFHSAGVEVHVWTINDAPSMERLLENGVDGIVTDRADRAIDIVARRARR